MIECLYHGVIYVRHSPDTIEYIQNVELQRNQNDTESILEPHLMNQSRTRLCQILEERRETGDY